MTAATVLATGLGRSYADAEALSDVHLRLGSGIVTVLGPNGSGKTTLLRCLSTVTIAGSGTLLVDGMDPRHESDRTEIRRRTGYLPQEPGFAPKATAFDVVDYIAVLRGHHHERDRRTLVFDALDQVGLVERSSTRVDQLSGGMRRRLGLAQALLGSPSLLVLDEPAASLDPDERLRLREVVTERRHSATIVISTHHTDEAAIGDHVVVLDQGTVRFHGTPAALASRAAGSTWIQPDHPGGQSSGIRASWRLADGTYRCLGSRPPDIDPVEPTLEDGYLLLVN